MSTTLMQKDPNTGHYTVVAPQGMRYGYDQLNRIATATAFSAFAGNSWQPQTSTDAYLNTFTYDANGNILKQLRNSADAATNYQLDNLTYNYYPGTNQLASVNDVVNAGLLPDDIDNQASNNYEYDEIGNLITDTQGGITSIGWTVYGKIREINKANNTLNFTYAPDGNRVSKLTNNGNTYYVRDASGNIMATYTLKDECLTLTEHHLYGSSRLGTLAKEVCVNDGTVEDTVVYVERGFKRYELSNHLGNVLTTISDKRLCHSYESGVYYTAHILTVTDYYPFGSPMAGRTQEQEGYRFGFNGKENDNDIYGDGHALDFGARIYDSRLGRWLSVDPLFTATPYYSPYIFAGNIPISFIDEDGKYKKASYGTPPGSPTNVYIIIKSANEIKERYSKTTTMMAMGTFTIILSSDIEDASIQLNGLLKGEKADNIVIDWHGGAEGNFDSQGIIFSFSDPNSPYCTLVSSPSRNGDDPDQSIDAMEIMNYCTGNSQSNNTETNNDIHAFESIMNNIKDGGILVNSGCLTGQDNDMVDANKLLASNRIYQYINTDSTPIPADYPELWRGGQNMSFDMTTGKGRYSVGGGWKKTTPQGETILLKSLPNHNGSISLDPRQGNNAVNENKKSSK